MDSVKFFVIGLGLLAAPVLAQSSTAPTVSAPTTASIKKGVMLFSADGRRIGRVDNVRGDSVGIIYEGHFITIPVSTLTAADRGFTTTLTHADVNKL